MSRRGLERVSAELMEEMRRKHPYLRPATHKRCPRCGRWLPMEAFRENPRLASGRNSWCRECAVEATRRWRAAHPEKVAEANAKRRVQEREFTCAECGETFTARLARLTCGETCRRERHRRFDRVRDPVSRSNRLRRR
jgi:hypothetical protein